MIISNKTDKQQKITLADLTKGGSSCDIYLEPASKVEIEKGMYVYAAPSGVIIEGVPFRGEDKNIPSVIYVESAEESEETTTKDPQEEVLAEKFICEECGAEFASARGLSTHIKRSHPDN